MALRCTRTASAAPHSIFCRTRISASATSPGSGRSLAGSTARSRRSSKSTPSTRSISPPGGRRRGLSARRKRRPCPTTSTTPPCRAFPTRCGKSCRAHRPRTIGHAGRLDGITPAALTLLAGAHVRRKPEARSRRGMSAGGEGRRPVRSTDLAADRDRALALTPVSRETAARLDRFVALLIAWQRHTNLIAPSTEPIAVDPAYRRFAAAPRSRAATRAIGSISAPAADFPGWSSPARWRTRPGPRPSVESIGKKAAFLREAVRVTGAPAIVHAVRIEDFVETAPKRRCRDGARSGAAARTSGRWLIPLLKRGALGLFPKGQDVEVELTEAAKYWKIQSSLGQSRTDPKGQIVIVRGHRTGEPRGGKQAANEGKSAAMSDVSEQSPASLDFTAPRASGSAAPSRRGCLPSPTRRAASARPRPPSISAPRSPRSARTC